MTAPSVAEADEQLRAARAEVERLRAGLRLAETQLARSEKLHRAARAEAARIAKREDRQRLAAWLRTLEWSDCPECTGRLHRSPADAAWVHADTREQACVRPARAPQTHQCTDLVVATGQLCTNRSGQPGRCEQHKAYWARRTGAR